MALLWECLLKSNAPAVVAHSSANGKGHVNANGTNGHAASRPVVRLPGDLRCLARRKDGQRCRGRIREGSDYCVFHDPAVSAEERRANAAKGGRSDKRRARLPRGYPARLDNLHTVQKAMDRLYREIRAGVVDLETGRALFEILRPLVEVHSRGETADDKARKRVLKLTAALEPAPAQTPSIRAATAI